MEYTNIKKALVVLSHVCILRDAEGAASPFFLGFFFLKKTYRLSSGIVQSPNNVHVLWVWGHVALLEIFFAPPPPPRTYSAPKRYGLHELTYRRE